jgi:hypothetical protein
MQHDAEILRPEVINTPAKMKAKYPISHDIWANNGFSVFFKYISLTS